MAADHAELLGAKLTALDERPLAEVLAGVRPQIACTYKSWFREQAVGWLASPGLLHGLGLIDAPDAATVSATDADGPRDRGARRPDGRRPAARGPTRRPR